MDLFQISFRDGTLPTEFTWQMVVLLPKGNGKYNGIGLTEVLWKTMLGLMNCGIQVIVILHDVLHRFMLGQGTGDASF